jgi:SAM-dependent methyltransferase
MAEVCKDELVSLGLYLRGVLGRGRDEAGGFAGAKPAQGTSQTNPFDVFLVPSALAINKARQDHLDSLGLDLERKRVLEVGAGIGLHTPFFLQRNCEVVVTDGNPANVDEIRRRCPELVAEVVDLEKDDSLHRLGDFDLVYCYGLLYHLADPARALARLTEVCRGQLLLETCVSLGNFEEVLFLRDFVSNNQAVSGIGCRPTRVWVWARLRECFGYAYMARTQPDHADFPTDWDYPPTQLLYRAVFVGSKVPLTLHTLTAEIPRQQPNLRSG